VIVQEQVYLSDSQRHIWVDLSARRGAAETLILIEIKGFEGHPSLVEALMSALGQYVVYKAMLDFLHLTEQLFLAIPSAAHDGIFQVPVAKQAIQNLGVRLLVFDPVAEEVILWTH
jgi:hypothetical protein